MTLKAPGMLTYMISVIIVVFVLSAKFFGASIPFINGHEFWMLFTAHILLMVGCLMRGL